MNRNIRWLSASSLFTVLFMLKLGFYQVKVWRRTWLGFYLILDFTKLLLLIIMILSPYVYLVKSIFIISFISLPCSLFVSPPTPKPQFTAENTFHTETQYTFLGKWWWVNTCSVQHITWGTHTEQNTTWLHVSFFPPWTIATTNILFHLHASWQQAESEAFTKTVRQMFLFYSR